MREIFSEHGESSGAKLQPKEGSRKKTKKGNQGRVNSPKESTAVKSIITFIVRTKIRRKVRRADVGKRRKSDYKSVY